MKIDFYVDENVLIPRADTENLVEEVIKICKEKEKCKILELCTGSGAIAISLKKYLSNVDIVATDISNEALKVAKKNEKKILKSECIQFIQSDMFENIKGKFDIIVSNPPYIKTEIVKKYDLKYEPILALDGGQDGLRFYKTIIENGYRYLNNNGVLALEIGYDQKDDVTNIVNDTKKYKETYCKKDLGGNDRVFIVKLMNNLIDKA